MWRLKGIIRQNRVVEQFNNWNATESAGKFFRLTSCRTPGRKNALVKSSNTNIQQLLPFIWIKTNFSLHFLFPNKCIAPNNRREIFGKQKTTIEMCLRKRKQKRLQKLQKPMGSCVLRRAFTKAVVFGALSPGACRTKITKFTRTTQSRLRH